MTNMWPFDLISDFLDKNITYQQADAAFWASLYAISMFILVPLDKYPALNFIFILIGTALFYAKLSS